MRDYKEFTLTADHVTLLRHAVVNDHDQPPALDPRYPWGRSGDVEDVAVILGWPLFTDHAGEQHLSAEQYEATERIEAEMPTALQIVLCTGGFTPGDYRTTSPYGSDWQLHEATP